MELARDYLRLTKPGVTAGNVLTAIAGYFLATAHYGFSWTTFLGMLAGMILVVGGSCALNNYYDRDIDAKMARTKTRPSVSKKLNPLAMRVYAYLLVIVGSGLLYLTTNLLTVVLGVVGFVSYVWIYGVWAKRKTIHGMAIGALPGALPAAGGYAAANGVIDPGLVIVFLIIFFWQFPEFYSITIYRAKEYKAAGIPAMPVVVGVRPTIIQIVIYTALYLISCLSLTVAGYTGWIYFVFMLLPGIYWLWLAVKGLRVRPEKAEVWARAMFKMSMYTILLLCLMMSIGGYLP